MINMKVRYEISDVNLRISNVTLPNAEDSYVLLKASDEQNNEVAFALSHEQAQYLENELYEANRRWKTALSAQKAEKATNESVEADFNNNEDQFTH
ncbi:hypothetical protein [Paenibacillus alkalitolerans]|uniref:hypothetical protein n=1 Tax=Paenibacillus alkalitolerans TaxID=2799335 RepID=UPI0018F64479|nr:hypothetical protein [Paenibacillus alkalitolerans]